MRAWVVGAVGIPLTLLPRLVHGLSRRKSIEYLAGLAGLRARHAAARRLRTPSTRSVHAADIPVDHDSGGLLRAEGIPARAAPLVPAGTDFVHGVPGRLPGIGQKTAERLLLGLRTWLEEKEYVSVEQMKGSMSQRNSPDPAAFERANYVKTIQSYSSKTAW